MWDLVSWSGIQPRPPALGAHDLSHLPRPPGKSPEGTSKWTRGASSEVWIKWTETPHHHHPGIACMVFSFQNTRTAMVLALSGLTIVETTKVEYPHSGLERCVLWVSEDGTWMGRGVGLEAIVTVEAILLWQGFERLYLPVSFLYSVEIKLLGTPAPSAGMRSCMLTLG